MADSNWSPPASELQTASWSPPATELQEQPEANAPEETVGRAVGLGARAVLEGAAGLPHELQQMATPMAGALLMKPFVHHQTENIAPNADYSPQLSDFVHPEHWREAAHYFADKAGLPTPQTNPEKIGSKALEALPSAVLAPEAPIEAGVASMLGGAGSEIARQNGVGPIGQTAAGIAAGSLLAVPSAAAGTARALVRGGEEGRQAMAQRVQTAKDAGTTLDVGQASQNLGLQFLAGASSKLWGGGPINKLAEKQTRDIHGNVGAIIDKLADGEPIGPAAAGTAITEGIGNVRTPGTYLGDMRRAEQDAYDKVDELVDPQQQMDASGTVATINKIATPGRIVPVSGSINTIRNNLLAKIKANSQPTGFEGVGNPPPPPPLLAYSDLRALKTELGNSIDWGFAPADPVGNGQMKQLYNAVRMDLKKGVSSVSDEAAIAQAKADKLYGENDVAREALVPIMKKNGGPEQVYQYATNGTRLGATRINQVMTAINPVQKDIVRATVLDKLGHANGATDRPFSASTFLTKWQTMDPTAKDALFGSSGPPGSLRHNLDALADTIKNIQQGTKLRNPSGTGEAVGHSAGAVAVWEGLKDLLAGSAAGVVGAAGGIAGNHLLARALTSPKVVNWLTKATKAPTSMIPNLVNQLSTINDPDAQDLHRYLTQPQPTARASGGRTTASDDQLVDRLMHRYKAAKAASDRATKPLLRVPDETIIHALKITGSRL